MIGILLILASALGLYVFLYQRYQRIQANMRDVLSGRVQHMERLPPPAVYEPFLPGSRLQDRMGDLGRGLDSLEVTPEVTRAKKRTARRRSLVRGHADIRRSYIIDALLEKPKF
jgi:hypothetical protein